ncbi:DNA phosphorothioation-dependent restriction protein DptF [Vibrio kyushuensis]|uniref:DNA phosphorothioation-dependent restriction protein DptF n=1 Tax=Vibrio kyushuensis TaxID=2910249 RepID=UPI003D0DF9DA
MSKSSPYAVSTEKDSNSELDKYKDYLYINTPLEMDFESALDDLLNSGKKILFLCGSSGDGKSEIMTRYSQNEKYSRSISFHLDATHSFDPKLDAIATLNNRFSEYKAENSSLVVGINLGMMANFAKNSENEHDDIKAAMLQHLEKSIDSDDINFLSFENKKYSKFCFKNGQPSSDFASSFMQKLTQKTTSEVTNPFWDLMIESEVISKDEVVVANFKLLAIESIQNSIIELLLKGRLVKDQFVTARSFLDFIHILLVRKGYLFDNLFLTRNNELSERLISFDPALIRSEKIDRFILSLKLKIEDPAFYEFNEELKKEGVIGLKEPSSYLRLFYILQNSDFANNYHQDYRPEFKNTLLQDYAKVLLAHQNYTGEDDEAETNTLNDFYRHTLFSALWRYINRSAPQLKKKQYLISKENSVLFATELKLLVDWGLIIEYDSESLMSFNALIKVNRRPIQPALPVNINLFELLHRLNSGYRPNKYDKSCVLLLDELVEQIRVEMAKSDTLIIVDGVSTYDAERDGSLIEIVER